MIHDSALRTKRLTSTNSLLAALPRQDLQALLAGGKQVALSFGEVLYLADEQIHHVYFPTEGFISSLTAEGDPPTLEVGLIGTEGMLGASLILGIDTAPLRGLVQGKGIALRLSTARFRREVSSRAALRRVLGAYVYVLMQQLAQMVACSRHHEVNARLARWLLMTQDRAHAAQFHLTHQFLARMLGVRREGVTEAAGRMQQRRLIGYKRGHIEVLNRRRLEAASCSCYRTDLATYQRILG
jgi:CRP-like cAMP-binding protein